MNLEINHEQNKKNSSNDFTEELKNYISKPVTFSIDRFEGDFAICENKQTNEMVNIEKSLLPNNSKEGDIIKLENGIYVLDVQSTNKEQEEVKNLVNNLFNHFHQN